MLSLGRKGHRFKPVMYLTLPERLILQDAGCPEMPQPHIKDVVSQGPELLRLFK